MFHANGWGGPFAITAMGATHVVLRAVVARGHLPADRAGGRDVRLHGAGGAQHDPQLPGQGRSTTITTRPRFVVAGAPPPAAFIERLEKELGWEFIQIYGLTETAPILTVSTPGLPHRGRTTTRAARARASRRSASTSRCSTTTATRCRRTTTTIGEVCARSNVVLKGYWEQPEETAKAIYDGYFHTRRPGGLGRVRQHPHRRPQEGRDHLRRREHQLARDRGRALQAPGGARVRGDRRAQREVGRDAEGADRAARRARRRRRTRSSSSRREHLAHFKCPTSVEFVESLPRTATGKLQKFVIREPYWQGVERRVG